MFDVLRIKRARKKPQLPETIFLNSASYARISRRDCETSYKQVPAKKRVEKEESLGKLLRNNFDN